MKIIIAQSGASGAIYTRQIVELAIADPAVSHIALVRTDYAKAVSLHEDVVELPQSDKITEYTPDDMFSPIASGSARYEAMIIAPCSVGMVGRLASGVSDSLICRAGDVMLKEGRKLILVVRESPLSLIHLRNMTTLSEAGATIMPASPSFYHQEKSVEELCHTISKRAASMIGIECDCREWNGKKL